MRHVKRRINTKHEQGIRNNPSHHHQTRPAEMSFCFSLATVYSVTIAASESPQFVRYHYALTSVQEYLRFDNSTFASPSWLKTCQRHQGQSQVITSWHHIPGI